MNTVPETVTNTPAGALVRTDLPLPDRREGKVRDLYRLPAAAAAPRLLIVATDRISAFDVVLPTPIPGKGRLLTEISLRWFELIRMLGLIPDHILSSDARDVPGLDVHQQAAIDAMITAYRKADEKWRPIFREKLEVVEVDPSVRAKLASGADVIWAEWVKTQEAKGRPSQKMLDFVKASVAKHDK